MAAVDLLLNNEQSHYDIEPFRDLITRAFLEVLAREGADPDVEVSLTFVDDEQIRVLNREYRAKDTATDVLSFPQDDEDGFMSIPGMPQVLGDIVISLPRAEEQAETFGHSLEREVVYLAVHGLLHLLGFDHEDEEGRAEMRAREEAVMEAIGLRRGE
ncbi:MAG TPA: rRNA maturation RNase YbeY [Firmicutes bacterium]|nr:rRNA maturation RNase YbeY [Bacillota bacterium]